MKYFAILGHMFILFVRTVLIKMFSLVCMHGTLASTGELDLQIERTSWFGGQGNLRTCGRADDYRPLANTIVWLLIVVDCLPRQITGDWTGWLIGHLSRDLPVCLSIANQSMGQRVFIAAIISTISHMLSARDGCLTGFGRLDWLSADLGISQRYNYGQGGLKNWIQISDEY